MGSVFRTAPHRVDYFVLRDFPVATQTKTPNNSCPCRTGTAAQGTTARGRSHRSCRAFCRCRRNGCGKGTNPFSRAGALNSTKFERYGVIRNGILLYGPRGTGKTFLARATAGEFGIIFEYVSAPTLLNRWIGATAGNIQGVFAQAASRKPVLFFIDDRFARGWTARRNQRSRWRGPGSSTTSPWA